jgi:hypothetical protein
VNVDYVMIFFDTIELVVRRLKKLLTLVDGVKNVRAHSKTDYWNIEGLAPIGRTTRKDGPSGRVPSGADADYHPRQRRSLAQPRSRMAKPTQPVYVPQCCPGSSDTLHIFVNALGPRNAGRWQLAPAKGTFQRQCEGGGTLKGRSFPTYSGRWPEIHYI